MYNFKPIICLSIDLIAKFINSILKLLSYEYLYDYIIILIGNLNPIEYERNKQ